MSWALIAAAAAGLNAGAGLHCILMDQTPSPTTESALSEAHWQVQRSTAASKITMSSTLAAIAAGASFGAYASAGDTADPAYITCGLISATIPLYNFIVMAPTAAVVSNKVMDQVAPAERSSWVASFQRKSWVAAGLAVASFGCTLLVLRTERAGDATANPLRY